MVKTTLRLTTVLLALTLVVAACQETTEDTAPVATTAGTAVGPKTIRFTFAPDPVWDWLNDQGIREEMEIAADTAILQSPTWNEVGIYAGGNADIISVGDFEVPTIEQEFGIPSVIFGKYNIDRSVIVAPAGSDKATLADCAGGTVAVWDALSSTTIWGVLANELHELDFRVGGGDFELVVVDITSTAEQVVNGSTDCAIALPDFSVSQMVNEEVKVLYDGKPSAELYAELVESPGHEGPMINIFLARADWYDNHPDEVSFFLSLWDRGLDEWAANKDTIIESYPQHFAVEGEEQIAWMKDYLNQHDWFATDIYLTQEWVDSEAELFTFLESAGLSETSEPPRFDLAT